MKAHEAFEFNIERANNLVTLYQTIGTKGGGADIDDLLRASYVLAVGALDAYVHDRVSERLVPFTKSKLNSTGDELKPIRKLLADVEPIEFLRWLTLKRPFVQVHKVVEEAIGAQSFQHPGKIEEAFNLIGKRQIWSSVADKMTINADDLKRDLARAATRRNQIVHEGDREKAKLKKHRKRPLTSKEVTDLIELISEVGNQLNQL